MMPDKDRVGIAWQELEAGSPEELLSILRRQNKTLEQVNAHQLTRNWHARAVFTPLPHGSIGATVTSEMESFGSSGPVAVFLFNPKGKNAIHLGRKRHAFAERNTILLPEEPYRTFYSETQTRLNFVVTRERLDACLASFGLGEHAISESRRGAFDPQRFGHFESQFERVINALNGHDADLLDVKRFLAVQEELLLVAAAHALCIGVKDTGPRPSLLAHRRACDYIDAHATGVLRIADIAGVAGLSIRALAAAFRLFEETTIGGYVLALRLARVRQALAAPSGLSPQEIAHRCGFAHFGAFRRAYRARYGMDPRPLD